MDEALPTRHGVIGAPRRGPGGAGSPDRWRRGHRVLLLAALSLLALVLVLGWVLRTGDGTEAPEKALGVYVGPAAVGELERFEDWLGREVHWVVDFVSDTRWSDIAHPGWWVEGWAGTDRSVVFSLPLLPRDEGSLAQGASGEYDEVFAQSARTLIEAGHGSAVIRLGWEPNLDVFAWSAVDDPEAFVAYWRRVVDVMRAQEGAAFRFDWTISAGPSAMEAVEAYPGDAYVDIIGLDAYDYVHDSEMTDPAARWEAIRTQPYGLEWHRDFAAARDKPISFPEWGVWDRPDGGGGGDNPFYIEQMHAWFAQVRPLYQAYFEHPGEPGHHELLGSRFPRAGARYRTLFGGAQR